MYLYIFLLGLVTIVTVVIVYRETLILLWKHRSGAILLWKYRKDMLSMVLKNLNNDQYKPNIIVHNNHVNITYFLDGSEHNIRVPREKKIKHHRMYLMKDGTEIDITHKHGIKYLCTARDLNGDYIVKKVMDEEVDRFHIDEIPK